MIPGVPSLMVATYTPTQGTYNVPPDRRINWSPSGLDVVGGIPTSYAHTTTITGLDSTGATDCTSTIQSFITAASADTLLLIPAGIYKINGLISMKSRVTLRGAKASGAPFLPTADATATTIIMNGRIFWRGGDKDHNWYPGRQLGIAITAGYTWNSSTLTLTDASALSIGDLISVYQNRDAALIEDLGRSYLGEDSGPDPHCWSHYTRITGKSGNVITIDPPIYQVTPSPTGQSVRKQTNDINRAGLENMRLQGTSTNYRPLWLQFCEYCWIKDCETYQLGGTDGSGSPHVWTEFCYANEYRGNYCHQGDSHDSGQNYGLEFYHWNSRHKIEDNIVRETRHSIIFEGGGAGCAVLYNYTDDNWESIQGQPTVRDPHFLSEDAVTNHGAHPMMILWEGNQFADWWGDYTQGSGSHNTLFRCSITGKQTSYTLTPSIFLWVCVEVEKYNRYYNLIGNIVGNTTMIGGGGTTVDDGLGGAIPTMFRFGYAGAGGSHLDSTSYSTAILHGNHDFVSNSVAHWVPTAQSHVLPPSLYYSEKPAFFNSLAWPPYSSVDPTNNGRERIPAGYRFVNGTPPP